jgi:hypothetical protein
MTDKHPDATIALCAFSTALKQEDPGQPAAAAAVENFAAGARYALKKGRAPLRIVFYVEVGGKMVPATFVAGSAASPSKFYYGLSKTVADKLEIGQEAPDFGKAQLTLHPGVAPDAPPDAKHSAEMDDMLARAHLAVVLARIVVRDLYDNESGATIECKAPQFPKDVPNRKALARALSFDVGPNDEGEVEPGVGLKERLHVISGGKGGGSMSKAEATKAKTDLAGIAASASKLVSDYHACMKNPEGAKYVPTYIKEPAFGSGLALTVSRNLVDQIRSAAYEPADALMDWAVDQFDAGKAEVGAPLDGILGKRTVKTDYKATPRAKGHVFFEVNITKVGSVAFTYYVAAPVRLASVEPAGAGSSSGGLLMPPASIKGLGAALAATKKAADPADALEE